MDGLRCRTARHILVRRWVKRLRGYAMGRILFELGGSGNLTGLRKDVKVSGIVAIAEDQYVTSLDS